MYLTECSQVFVATAIRFADGMSDRTGGWGFDDIFTGRPSCTEHIPLVGRRPLAYCVFPISDPFHSITASIWERCVS